MRKINYTISNGLVGCKITGSFEVDDEYDDEDIEDAVFDAVMDSIDWSWSED